MTSQNEDSSKQESQDPNPQNSLEQNLQQDTNQPAESVPDRGDIVDVVAIIQQLEDLVKFSLECEEHDLKPDISFVDVHKKLLQIQSDIQLFQENYRMHLAMLNLTPEDVRPTPEEVEALDPRQRKIFERMNALQSTCEDARERLYKSMQADQETLKSVKSELKEKSKEKEKIRRKGKFKGQGGKSGWIPT